MYVPDVLLVSFDDMVVALNSRAVSRALVKGACIGLDYSCENLHRLLKTVEIVLHYHAQGLFTER